MACINVFIKDETTRLKLNVSRICFNEPVEIFCYLLDYDGNELLDIDNKLLAAHE